jgi:hypothetical protein
MRLSFKDLNTAQISNYRLFKRYLRYCRDTLKALVIVDPSSEGTKYQYTVFAKAKSMPMENKRYVDAQSSYSTLDVEYDEGR